MAAICYKGRVVAGSFGKRLASQICGADSRDLIPVAISRRASHFDSHYQKEIEEQVRPAVVPDYMVDASSDKYWGPHPTTGVFGPADLNGSSGGYARGFRHSPAAVDGEPSALDQTVRFRPLELEDLDKSLHA
ncbi:hypothetical protein HPP92_020491 [Vanilla planifolia]|uniref:Uncharacterized protein n=1 Tax=Vanilla planifolia TaxID=51239 RepID=A0A835Q0K4_VANPL|nr:hypothetical protein HPP92_020885 [Vanilla planifolia]KAG0462015.1 hypothetical protein HPP92_020491 [Vanilla planifolia]